MIRIFTAGAIIAGFAAAGATAAIAQSEPAPDADSSKIICKYVVAEGPSRENKPYQMCMSKADWAKKEAHDAKDANRIVCKYQENPSSPHLKGYKICQPESEWTEQERLTREHFLLIQQGASPPH